MKKETVLNYIRNNSLAGIKAGTERPGFLNIWMVVVDDRIFARSWGFAEKSWYNSFLQHEAGQIKCGDDIFDIKAVIPADREALTEKINAAYLEKYNTGANAAYAQGIIRQAHIERTMEFIVTDE